VSTTIWSASRFGHRRLRELLLGPLGVRALEVARESAQVACVHRRDVAPHRDGVGHRVLTGEVELGEAPQRAHDGRGAPLALAEAERVRRVDDGELDAVGIAVEAVGEVAQQQQGRGAQGREPELLDVARPGVVPEGVDDGVVPGLDQQRGGHGFLRARAGAPELTSGPGRWGKCRPRIPSDPV
jgi:hypothetical protein